MATMHRLTVRIPVDLVRSIEQRTVAIGPFILAAVVEKLERDLSAGVASSLQCLAYDPEANDISDFAPVGSKALTRQGVGGQTKQALLLPGDRVR